MVFVVQYTGLLKGLMLHLFTSHCICKMWRFWYFYPWRTIPSIL